jgi:EAL domain-containing protein (putative c-di-GMP-specific phosphodiesterase class I)
MLAQILDLDVIAEGIETVEQLETYRTMDGGYAQGYYLFRPLPRNEIEDILAAK